VLELFMLLDIELAWTSYCSTFESVEVVERLLTRC